MTLRPATVLVSASGAPGTAALLKGLRANGERTVRLVGTDMSERSVGHHLCDAFHRVPDARQGVRRVLFDLDDARQIGKRPEPSRNAIPVDVRLGMADEDRLGPPR